LRQFLLARAGLDRGAGPFYFVEYNKTHLKGGPGTVEIVGMEMLETTKPSASAVRSAAVPCDAASAAGDRMAGRMAFANRAGLSLSRGRTAGFRRIDGVRMDVWDSSSPSSSLTESEDAMGEKELKATVALAVMLAEFTAKVTVTTETARVGLDPGLADKEWPERVARAALPPAGMPLEQGVLHVVRSVLTACLNRLDVPVLKLAKTKEEA
jgi:hypothetical protein